MPRQPSLSPGAIRLISAAVDAMFDRIKVRFLGPHSIDKRIVVGYTPELSLPGLFLAASLEESNKPDHNVLDSLVKVAGGYLDSERARTKSQVIKSVDAFLKEAHSGKVETDVGTVLGGELTKVWGDTARNIKRIIETESTTARNVGVLDGISKINDAAGIDDPVVYFVVVNDQHLCDECRSIHLLKDGVTPRVWKMSEVGHAYHKKGDDFPAIGGLHPICRCSLVTLMPGYGFQEGAVAYIAPEHNEFAKQRG